MNMRDVSSTKMSQIGMSVITVKTRMTTFSEAFNTYESVHTKMESKLIQQNTTECQTPVKPVSTESVNAY